MSAKVSTEAVLRIRIDELEEEVRQLRAAHQYSDWVKLTFPLPTGLSLEPQAAALVGVLMAHDHLHHERICQLMSPYTKDGYGMTRGALQVQILAIRDVGIKVETLWGLGYAIDRCERDRLARHIDAGFADFKPCKRKLKKYIRWTPDEDARLAEGWRRGLSLKEISPYLPDRNYRSFSGRAKAIGLGPHPQSPKKRRARHG